MRFLIFSIFLVSATTAAVLPRQVQVSTGYSPIAVQCPSNTPLVRPANALNKGEATYRTARKLIADKNLKNWLQKTNRKFNPSTLPALALTTSGGGYRSLLVGAGVIQGFDARDSTSSVAGIYQSLTYEAGLSGGGWLLSSLAGNNWPTVTSIKNALWSAAFEEGLEAPDGALAAAALAQVTADLVSKQDAGFPPTLTDAWGRLLSYQLLQGTDGGVVTKLSSLLNFSNFTSHAVPYPVITSLGVKTWEGECLPGPNATQYEFSPYEFGSWDHDVAAFTPTSFLGTTLSNGVPVSPNTLGLQCTNNYDNLGYVLGTSSSLFNEACSDVPDAVTSTLEPQLSALLTSAHQTGTRDEYAIYPNPFFNYSSPALTLPPQVIAQPDLSLVDGGEALQNNPIWPFLQPSRGINVIIVNDNSADTSNNFPNGSEILTTYTQALTAGLTRMPYIPSVDTFIAQGLNQRPTFFGCNDSSTATIIYIPNVNITYMSNQSTSKLEYMPAETDGMIGNGYAMASFNNSLTWPTCLGCGILSKESGKLPVECTACFQQYCFYGQ